MNGGFNGNGPYASSGGGGGGGGGGGSGGGQYMHRGQIYAGKLIKLNEMKQVNNSVFQNAGNIPQAQHSSLDLAGSREQRGSAFELYRKPQLGNVPVHHHNIR